MNIEEVRQCLQELCDERGHLTPGLVMAAASEETHPLHPYFDWNNETAGDAWRLEQARRLIRSVRVVYRPATDVEEAKSVRAYHSVRTPDGNAYQSVEQITADPFLTKLVLRDMEADWKALRRRYEHFAEFGEMVRRDLDSGDQAA